MYVASLMMAHRWFHTKCVQVPQDCLKKGDIPWLCALTQSGIRPPKDGDPQKLGKSDNRKVVKIVKVHFHFLVVVVIVVVQFQFQLAYLKNRTELRAKLCELIEIHN